MKHGKLEARAKICGENESGSGIDNDALVEEEMGSMRNRANDHDRRSTDYVEDGLDKNMDNIKMTIS